MPVKKQPWEELAAALKVQRQGDPGAFTTKDFAQRSDMTYDAAKMYLRNGEQRGTFRRAKKREGDRVVPAWVMVTK